jgi:hypothetical protein
MEMLSDVVCCIRCRQMVMSHMMLVSRVLNGLLNSEETGAQDEST